MGWLRRWWWLGVPLVPVLLIALIGITIRQIGFAELDAVHAEIVASGQPVDYAAWRASLPTVDPQRGEALRTVIDGFKDLDVRSLSQAVTDARSAAVEPRHRSATAAMRWHAQSATRARRIAVEEEALAEASATASFLLAALRPLLAAEPAVPLTRTWTLPEDPGQATRWFMSSDTFAYLLQPRSAAEALAVSASHAVDPAADLNAIRRLATSVRIGPTLIDAMIAMAIDDYADRAHWQAIRNGSLTASDAHAWIGSIPDPTDSVRRAMIAERISRTVIDLSTVSLPPGMHPPESSWLDLWHAWVGWVHEPGLQADEQRGYLLMASTSAIIPIPERRRLWMDGDISSLVLTNLQECAISALVSEGHARTYRAASVIWRHANREADADLDHRLRSLLDGSPGRIRLGWERLGPRRFRVGVDPHAPQPVPTDRVLGMPDRRLGAPSAPQAKPDQIAHHVLEFDLP